MVNNERVILEALRRERRDLRSGDKYWRGWMTPTDIGTVCGKPHKQACSWACRYLKFLLNEGLVMREPPGVYVITKEGLKALADSTERLARLAALENQND